MNQFTYTRKRALASGIPLGGLGTGSIELRDDGRFHDWEICNNNLWSGDAGQPPPQMWSEDAFFALRIQEHGAPHPKVRLLYDDDKRSRAVALDHDFTRIYNFPFMWNIQEMSYKGQYPFADLTYRDERIPLAISMRAFTPFIPHNAKDSGLPLAYFVFKVANTGSAPCDASLMFSLRNFVGYDQDTVPLRHQVFQDGGCTGVSMGADIDRQERTWGSLCTQVLDPRGTWATAWSDGRGLAGFENAHTPGMGQTFQHFRDHGTLPCGEKEWSREESVRTQKEERVLCEERTSIHHWRGSVCSKTTLQPGEEKEIVFMMSWHFPNHYMRGTQKSRIGHMYENWFCDARDVARYGMAHFSRLYSESRRFCDNLYTGMESWLADSLNAQLTTFPQGCWWTKNGDFTMWEGVACCQLIHGGSTPWSSFVPLMFFPDLYMRMKERTARFEGGEGDGSVTGLLEAQTIARREAQEKREREAREQGLDPAKRGDLGGWLPQRYRDLGYADATFGARGGNRQRRLSPHFGREAMIVQLLRDYQWSGNTGYLKEIWPVVREQVQRVLQSDANGDGLPDGEAAFITYDHWFLPGLNCYSSTMLLGEFAAAVALARVLGDDEILKTVTPVLEKGIRSFEERLWNGAYYNLAWDFRMNRADTGCLADQVSGHLYLRLCGLPGVHPDANVKTALASVMRHNLKPEEGLLNGTDPHGRTDWTYFARYSASGEDEQWGGQWPTPWTGTEYYVAAVMIAEGMVSEGLQVIKAVYDRHIAYGQLYNHIECGEHYFRPLSVWAVLPALAGLVREEVSGLIRFVPKVRSEDFDSAFILPLAWGRLRQLREPEVQINRISVEEGGLKVAVVEVAEKAGRLPSSPVIVSHSGMAVECESVVNNGVIRIALEREVMVGAGDVLTVRQG